MNTIIAFCGLLRIVLDSMDLLSKGEFSQYTPVPSEVAIEPENVVAGSVKMAAEPGRGHCRAKKRWC